MKQKDAERVMFAMVEHISDLKRMITYLELKNDELKSQLKKKKSKKCQLKKQT